MALNKSLYKNLFNSASLLYDLANKTLRIEYRCKASLAELPGPGAKLNAGFKLASKIISGKFCFPTIAADPDIIKIYPLLPCYDFNCAKQQLLCLQDEFKRILSVNSFEDPLIGRMREISDIVSLTLQEWNEDFVYRDEYYSCCQDKHKAMMLAFPCILNTAFYYYDAAASYFATTEPEEKTAIAATFNQPVLKQFTREKIEKLIGTVKEFYAKQNS